MTEKRFTIEIDDEKWVHILDNNVDIGQYNLCKVLNELYEENKELKEQFNRLRVENQKLRAKLYEKGDFE